jgi:AcrR family transcriptional regulator
MPDPAVARDPRQRILDAAKDVFAENGYRGGSLNEVAKRAGYTRAGLLHHFPSKEAMLLALLDQRDERLHAFDDGDEDAAWHGMMHSMPDLVATIIEDRVLVQLGHVLTTEASDPRHPAHDWAASRHRELRRRSAVAISHSIARGDLPADTDADALAAVLLGAVEGVEGQWLVDPEVDPVACAREIIRLVDALMTSARLASSPDA